MWYNVVNYCNIFVAAVVNVLYCNKCVFSRMSVLCFIFQHCLHGLSCLIQVQCWYMLVGLCGNYCWQLCPQGLLHMDCHWNLGNNFSIDAMVRYSLIVCHLLKTIQTLPNNLLFYMWITKLIKTIPLKLHSSMTKVKLYISVMIMCVCIATYAVLT